MSGWSVSISGDGSIIAIGSPRNDANGSNAGSVKVYDFDGAIWNQIGQTILGDTVGDESGRGLSLNNDGSILAIGATGYGQTDFGQSDNHTQIVMVKVKLGYLNILVVLGAK